MDFLYHFERAEGLDLLPICARRALDAAGLKLSLAGWKSLSMTDRQALAEAGVPDEIDPAPVEAIAMKATHPPERMPRIGDPPADRPSEELALAAVSHGPTLRARWPGLRPLDRYAVAKVGRRGASERYDAALREILAG